MGERIPALYENGVLRPLAPVALRERQHVYIQIMSLVALAAEDVPVVDKTQAAMQTLIQEGVLTPPPGKSTIAPIPDAQRATLADRMGRAPGKPLSEIIIEERGEV
jgi:predicted DNA-binding antitoxin AbrB/MazE fold protein